MHSHNEDASEKAEIPFAILGALERLLCASSLSEISVTAICEEAHISRAAFYKHFSDKREVGKCAQHLDNVGSMGYRQANLAMLEGFSRYRSYYSNAFVEQGEQSLFQYALYEREKKLEQIIFEDKGVAYSVAFSYQIAAFNAAAVQAVVTWIQQDMRMPHARMAELLDVIIPPKIREALEGCESG